MHSCTKISCLFRRAQLKACYETLKNEIPTLEDKRTSNLNILKSAFRYIQVSWYSIMDNGKCFFVSCCFEDVTGLVLKESRRQGSNINKTQSKGLEWFDNVTSSLTVCGAYTDLTVYYQISGCLGNKTKYF